MNILVPEFHGYIGNIGKILVNILTKISVRQKLFKIHGIFRKKNPKK